MQPPPDSITEDAPLEEAITRMREQGLEYLPVVASKEDPHLVGMLGLASTTRRLASEVLQRRQQAEAA
ncbi:MAG: CBS domain-containing protein [Sedimentisphaerales bacterium]|nr:CBS domain-containing protein [Sedimentisphaerales bacterium]